jgi:hypothetical protein
LIIKYKTSFSWDERILTKIRCQWVSWNIYSVHVAGAFITSHLTIPTRYTYQTVYLIKKERLQEWWLAMSILYKHQMSPLALEGGGAVIALVKLSCLRWVSMPFVWSPLSLSGKWGQSAFEIRVDKLPDSWCETHDWLPEDAYSSLVRDATFVFVGGPWYSTLDSIYVWGIMITFKTVVTSPIGIWH